ncbi:MAG: universal stress protein, partial [Candidatus Latescibacterota bacterium]
RKILVALDGSPASRNALEQSLHLATDHKSLILATTVMPAFAGDLDLTGVADTTAAIEGPGARILAEAREIARASRGFMIRTTLEEGEPYERIIALAAAEGCDLIVLGRHGRGHLASVFLGRVVTRVIGYGPPGIDVLVVPDEATIGWGRILLATDGSLYSEKATERALSFAQAYGESVQVLSVATTNDEFEALAPRVQQELVHKAREVVAAVVSRAGGRQITATGLVREGDAADCIIRQAQEEQVDAVVMGSHGRTGLPRLLVGSVTERVVGLAPCPVLVVNAARTGP